MQLPVQSLIPLKISLPKQKFHGLTLAIETKKHELRIGATWSHTSPADYGFIEGFDGSDGDEMDCYLGSDRENTEVYVVDQNRIDSPNQFDEHKCMLGFSNLQQAKAVYLAGHDQGTKIFRGITKMSLPDFKLWLKNGDLNKPLT